MRDWTGLARLVIIAVMPVIGSACRKAEVAAKPAAGSETSPAPDSGPASVYRLRSGQADLRVEWREIDSSTAMAALVSRSDSPPCENRFTGRFRTKPGEDPEILVNEDGDAIVASRYLHESDGCRIEIKVGEGVMQVRSADCRTGEKDGCRFESEALLALEARS